MVSFQPCPPDCQSAFFVVRGEDLPRATFAKTIESIVEPLFSPRALPRPRNIECSLAGLQSMAVSNEISGVQEQNIECASVQFYLSAHFKCAHKLLNLYL